MSLGWERTAFVGNAYLSTLRPAVEFPCESEIPHQSLPVLKTAPLEVLLPLLDNFWLLGFGLRLEGHAPLLAIALLVLLFRHDRLVNTGR